ncbi:MAG: hypothetical protein ABF322_11190, partial [Lentimonas sp.]
MSSPSTDLREQARHYIPATDADIEQMFATVGKESFKDLFDHIPSEVLFAEAPALPDELDYEALKARLQ